MSDLKIVTIINGERHPLTSCMKIKGEYYLVADSTIENTDSFVCFNVEEKHYRLSAGSIIYDHRLKKYVLRTQVDVERGVIAFDKDYNPIFGAFSKTRQYENIIINYKRRRFECINIDILQPLLDKEIYQERLSSGVFYKRTDLPITEFNKIRACDEDYKRGLAYNSGGALESATNIFKKRYKPTVFNDALSKYENIAKDYTFGLEFETVKGDIPARICNTLGLIPLRDGSIDGIEFVTIPHSGKKGMQAILDSLKELSKRTTYDKNCALHIHVGNLPRTVEFFCALTKVLCVLQPAIYKQFPFYTKGGYRLKNKDYTAPLPAEEILAEMPNKINKDNMAEAFEPIFQFLSMGHTFKEFDNDLSNVTEHPSDPRGNSKWYVKSRYRWVNMIPLLFGNKETVEFRIHTPTYDPDKVINFLILCLAIVDYAKKNETNINSGKYRVKNYDNIQNIVYTYISQFSGYGSLENHMNNYWKVRKNYQQSSLLNGDFYANEDDFYLTKKLFQDFKSTSKDILTKDLKNVLYGDDWNNFTTVPSSDRGFRININENIRNNVTSYLRSTQEAPRVDGDTLWFRPQEDPISLELSPVSLEEPTTIQQNDFV